MTFIDQFKALHQCNKYCKMLGLTSLQNNNQKQKKPSVGKKKNSAKLHDREEHGVRDPSRKENLASDPAATT